MTFNGIDDASISKFT